MPEIIYPPVVVPLFPKCLSADDIAQLKELTHISTPKREIGIYCGSIDPDGDSFEVTQDPFLECISTFTNNGVMYTVDEELLLTLNSQAWESFRHLSIQTAWKYFTRLEHRLELEVDKSSRDFVITERGLRSKEVINGTPWIDLSRYSMTRNFKNIVETFVTNHLETNLFLWHHQGKARVGQEFYELAGIYSHYLLILYLKWRLEDSSDAPMRKGIDFEELILSLINPEIKNVEDDKSATNIFSNTEKALIFKLLKYDFSKLRTSSNENFYKVISAVESEKHDSVRKGYTRANKIMHQKDLTSVTKADRIKSLQKIKELFSNSDLYDEIEEIQALIDKMEAK